MDSGNKSNSINFGNVAYLFSINSLKLQSRVKQMYENYDKLGNLTGLLLSDMKYSKITKKSLGN